MSILVTGGAGFIGTNFILNWLAHSKEPVVNLDNLTYAGKRENLHHLTNDKRYYFCKGSIGDKDLITHLLREYQPRAIINFAAETHVDRSIMDPGSFIQTNIVDTFSLLHVVHQFYENLSPEKKEKFRFLHISTDEVFGSLSPTAAAFTENSLYQPNSPYSASKASSDHLVRAYHHTYGLPVLTTHCSNNYGPYQFPEKFIPHMIQQALAHKILPIYGNGQQIRDWLYVDDHCNALREILARGRPGDTYNIGSNNEKTNLEVVHHLCDLLDQLTPREDRQSYKTQLAFVTDRPGHDKRYAINASKIQQELGWKPLENFDSGLLKTVRWYIAAHQQKNSEPVKLMDGGVVDAT